jgi:hypothetical protein
METLADFGSEAHSNSPGFEENELRWGGKGECDRFSYSQLEATESTEWCEACLHPRGRN